MRLRQSRRDCEITISGKTLYTKKDWPLYPSAFQKLLAWFDEASNSDGQNYLRMRTRLIAYFDRKNCITPEDLADETLNRVARRLDEEGKIESDSPAKYCYIVARFVFMEHLRYRQKETSFQHEALRQSVTPRFPDAANDETNELKEVMLNCL